MTNTLVHHELLAGRRTISRREFVHGIGLAVVSSMMLSVGIDRLDSARTATQAATQAATLTMVRPTFAPYVGDTFQIRLDSSELLSLQLFKVRDLLSAGPLASRGFAVDPDQSFSILFRGPADRLLVQDVYQFEHARLGAFELFLVPMRPERDGTYYEAIFNRLREQRLY